MSKGNFNVRISSKLLRKAAYELITDEGVKNADFQLKDQRLSFRIPDMEACKIYVFDTKQADIAQLQALICVTLSWDSRQYKNQGETERGASI